MPDSTNPADWYTKVAEQLGAAEKLLSDFPVQALIHTQQAAEMLLKGRLLEAGHSLERTHSVEYLQKQLVRRGIAFSALSDPALLDASYFDARYPASGYVAPSHTEITSALMEVKMLATSLAPAHFPPPASSAH
ncbi:MAG TPA: HEPN domain-containing protein [Candidatus Methylacidiphilales bacterium]|jgi:HEPN domain-containing protein|nr:HEPN domain-containing protein [Candidatus Methylacidiphilales bacterium]